METLNKHFKSFYPLQIQLTKYVAKKISSANKIFPIFKNLF